MNAPLRSWRWLAVEPHQLIGLRVLQGFLGAMLLFRMSTELRFAAFLWGPRGIGQGSTVPVYGRFGTLLDLVCQSDYAAVALALTGAVAGMCLIFGKWTRLATIAAFIVVQIVELRLPELCDGGDNVARLVLGYMVFCLPNGSKPKPGSLRIWLHNIAVLAIGLQLCVLYFTSGLLKLTGERWTHGTATYLISQVEWFSLPGARDIFKNSVVAFLSTYATMLFQFWFPVAIFTRAKLVWLSIGIAFHFNIAVIMGLVTFSLAMTGLELFLVTDEEWRHLAGGVDRLVARFSPRRRLLASEAIALQGRGSALGGAD